MTKTCWSLVQCGPSLNPPTSKSITGDIPESSLGSCNFSYTGSPVTSSQMATMLKASPISYVATVTAPVLLCLSKTRNSLLARAN